MTQYRYVISEETNPYKNIAMEQLLFQYASEQNIILFLWQNDNTIVIGKNQDVYQECKVEEFLTSGGLIARRRSGGGAVFHDMGNLNFSIISPRCLIETDNYQNLIFNALEIFNIKAEYNGRNDLVIEGKKFSGNAAYSNGNVLCQHGTILINTNIDKMTYYLTPDNCKLQRNHVKSIAARVINLSEISQIITIEKMIDALINVSSAVPLEIEYNDGLKNLEAIYSDSQWIYGGVL